MCKKYFLSYLLHMQRYSLFCLFENKNRCFLPKNDEKRKNFHFFQQKKSENIFFTEKSCTFASQLSLGLWCNGNTADSGPAFPGSSPGSPTERFPIGNLFFCLFSVISGQLENGSSTKVWGMYKEESLSLSRNFLWISFSFSIIFDSNSQP